MGKEEAQKKLQELAVQAKTIIDQMAGIAHANGITSIPFLYGALQFGVEFDGPSPHSREGSVRNLGGYHSAMYPRMIDDGYEWMASHFECFPGETERAWLFGDDEANWPKTDYEDDE